MIVTIPQLEAAFDRELIADIRAAAEIAYAIAFRYRSEDWDGGRRFDLAKRWAERSIELLESGSSLDLEDVTSSRQSVGGVAIPDLFHDGVVRSRLADVLE